MNLSKISLSLVSALLFTFSAVAQAQSLSGEIVNLGSRTLSVEATQKHVGPASANSFESLINYRYKLQYRIDDSVVFSQLSESHGKITFVNLNYAGGSLNTLKPLGRLREDFKFVMRTDRKDALVTLKVPANSNGKNQVDVYGNVNKGALNDIRFIIYGDASVELKKL